MHHVSPWPGNQQHDPCAPECTRSRAGSPKAAKATLKKYSHINLRELRINYASFSFKIPFFLKIQFFKYHSWTSFLLNQADNVKRRQSDVLKVHWLTSFYHVVSESLILPVFLFYMCFSIRFSLLDFQLFSNTLIIAICVSFSFLIRSGSCFSSLSAYAAIIFALLQVTELIHGFIFLNTYSNNIPTVSGKRNKS